MSFTDSTICFDSAIVFLIFARYSSVSLSITNPQRRCKSRLYEIRDFRRLQIKCRLYHFPQVVITHGLIIPVFQILHRHTLAFVDDYLNFVGEIPESHYRKELDSIYQKAQRALGRHGVVTEDEKMSERDFAKERRKVLREAKKAEKQQK